MENLSVNPENYKILVVDDIATNVLLLKTILGKAGYRIVTATGGREALEKVESESPDLILLDIMMPDMNGYEVMDENYDFPLIPPYPFYYSLFVAVYFLPGSIG